jgi:hypothetical protein
MQTLRQSAVAILIAAFGAAIALVLVACGLWTVFVKYGEPGDKEKYADIQAIDARYRSAGDDHFLLVGNVGSSSMQLLGIPTEHEPYPRAWVVLNRHNNDGQVILMPPDANLRRDCDQLEAVLKSMVVLPDVVARLRSEMKCSGGMRALTRR